MFVKNKSFSINYRTEFFSTEFHESRGSFGRLRARIQLSSSSKLAATLGASQQPARSVVSGESRPRPTNTRGMRPATSAVTRRQPTKADQVKSGVDDRETMSPFLLCAPPPPPPTASSCCGPAVGAASSVCRVFAANSRPSA